MILQIALQIVLPIFLLVGLWRGRFVSRLEWLLNVLVVAAILLFAFLTARWDSTSYYLRFVWPLLLVPAALKSYSQTTLSGKPPKARELFLNGALFLLFLGLNVVVLRGAAAPEGALHLAPPLKGGNYYVGGGGNARLINNHQSHDSQRFALDIVQLNSFGSRASALAPEDPARYAIFGETVYSPCSGVVVRAVDGLPDLRPPQRDTVHLAGNHILLECSGAKILLAHLKQGSVAVSVGSVVAEGDRVAQVGNSGNTSQPHLHLHAERGGEPDKILDGEGIPVMIAGRFLVRNSLFRGQ